MNTKARIHARRFLKLFYATGIGTDPDIGIVEGGAVTLKWVKIQINPQTGTQWTKELILTLHPDASYQLVVSEHCFDKVGRGAEADAILALRIARQSAGNRCTCVECGIDTDQIGEYFSLKDEVWKAAEHAETDHMLCIGCLEARIGRKLVPADFTDAPINSPGRWPHSDRMKDRLGYA